MTPWFSDSSYQQPDAYAAGKAECPFLVRAATTVDLHDVAQIITDSFHSPNGFWGWTLPILRLGIYEDLRHRLASAAPHQFCLVAVDTTMGNHSLVGTVELGVRYSDGWTHRSKSFVYLSNLAVHPMYRRQGVASSLLVGCEKLTKEWGFKDIYLHVLENNHNARQLYFKLGYCVNKVEAGFNTFFFKRAPQILLHKHLSVNPESTSLNI
ncbi:MAG: GNAT family N-acetyltransferase [Calothrix sp. C42_A2020_038]|nr:GNAT family N-acetyltransferase [Calothrix sp. C42_A2020_038]